MRRDNLSIIVESIPDRRENLSIIIECIKDLDMRISIIIECIKDPVSRLSQGRPGRAEACPGLGPAPSQGPRPAPASQAKQVRPDLPPGQRRNKGHKAWRPRESRTGLGGPTSPARCQEDPGELEGSQATGRPNHEGKQQARPIFG